MTETAQEEPRDPREELAELAAAVRAHAEWQAETGALGLPVDGSVGAILAELTGVAPRSTGPRAPSNARSPAPPPREAPRAAPFTPPPAFTPPASTPPAFTASPSPPVPAPPAPAPAAAPPAAATAAAAAPTSPDERKTRLALLAEQVRSCTACVLHEKRDQTVFSRGDPFSEIAFIGEGPGADEDATGIPFVGPAGQLLDRMIVAMGYRRDDVYVCNVVKCRPPNNRKPEPDEMASCMPFLVQQVGLVRPKVIVALGATAVQGLCGTTEGIARLRGKWKLFKGTTPIMPTFHPAYLLRNPAAKREVWLDLQEVLKHLGRSPPARA